MKSTTRNGLTCTLNDRHVYSIQETGQVLTSGTTFIKRFLPKFDAPAVAKETAIRRGTTAEALLKEWREKGRQASKDGDLVHSYAEWMFNDVENPPYSIEDDRVGKLTVQLLMACDKLQDKGFQPIAAEKIIFSLGLGIAGMIDLLLRDPAGRLVILDWKTNEELTVDNPFQECLAPIEHLEDANLVHHSLQLSLYQYILMTEGYYPDAKEYRRMVIHLTEDNNKPYFCRYLEDEIESMLI